MASTLAEQAALAASPRFQARVRATIIAAAASIAQIPKGALGASEFALREALASSVLQNADPHLTRFAWAIATNAAVFGDIHQPVAIAGSGAGAPSVITTAAPHGFTDSTVVLIEGAADGAVNGDWMQHVLTATTFSIPGNGIFFAGPGGTATVQPADAALQSACNTVWSAMAGYNTATA